MEYPFRKRLKIAAASVLGSCVMRLLGATLRMSAPGPAAIDASRCDGGPLLCALWHGDHFPALWAGRGKGTYVVASQSADGQILTNILRHFGYRCVRGSSTRGGARALIDLAHAVKGGADVAIAVDGPKGPRRLAKPGIVLLAKMTGSPILPMAAAMRRYWQFGSWDRYRIPKPFTRAHVATGQPIHVPPDADDVVIEQKRTELEQSLLRLQEELENRISDRK